MNESIRLPEDPTPMFNPPEWDEGGCIVIKRCDAECVDKILADFVPIVLTCLPDDAILVQIDTLDDILDEQL